MKKAIVFLCAASLACAAFAGGASQGPDKKSGSAPAMLDWPAKPVQIIVPYGAGGDTDFNARTMAKYLEKELGKPVVVSNVVGSGGTIAATQVKNAPSDGYTVLFHNIGLNISKAAGMVDYSYADFQMGGIAAQSIGDVLLVRGNSPWKTVKDMIEDTQRNPGKYKITANTGGATHWVAIALQNAGAKFNIVNSGGSAERIPALLGGHVDVICNPISTVIDYLKKGDFRPLALSLGSGVAEFPDVPTMKASGIDCDYSYAYTFFFPKGTNPAIAEKLNAAVQKIVKNNAEYQNDIKTAYHQAPFSLGLAESSAYWAKDLEALMKISDKLQGK